jgi:hypothetical protein
LGLVDDAEGNLGFAKEIDHLEPALRLRPAPVTKLHDQQVVGMALTQPGQTIEIQWRPPEPRWELVVHGPELAARPERSQTFGELADLILARLSGHSSLALVIGHRPIGLDVEAEVIGRASRPVGSPVGRGDAVKGAVDLDEAEEAGVVGEP